MNGNWRYALFVTTMLLLAAPYTTAASAAALTDSPQTVQSGKLEILHSFCDPNKPDCTGGFDPSSLIRGSDGALYGIASNSETSTVFRFDPATRKFSNIYSTSTELIFWIRPAHDGNLIGGYQGGDMNGIFRLSLDGRQYMQLPAFCNDSFHFITIPYRAGTEDSQGNYYGAALVDTNQEPPTRNSQDAPRTDCLSGSMIYEIAQDGTFKELLSMPFTNPISPVMAPDGNLYGYNDRDAALYRLTPDGVYTALHTFDETVDGTNTDAPLVVGRDSMLYGNTRYFKAPDGTETSGTLFRSTLDGLVTTLHVSHIPIPPQGYVSETGIEIANMTLMPDGYLYGAYYDLQGQTGYRNGTIFRASAAGDITPLYHFTGHVNITPTVVNGRLVRGSDNALYGVSNGGGKYGWGMLFRYVPPPVQ